MVDYGFTLTGVLMFTLRTFPMNSPDELAHRVHSAGYCGTAGSSSMDVTCEGMCWVLQGNSKDCPDIRIVLTALGCPGAKRRSFSPHAMSRASYDCLNHVKSHVQLTH